MQARQCLLITIAGSLAALALAGAVGATSGEPCQADAYGHCFTDQDAYYADGPSVVEPTTADISFDGVSRCWRNQASHSKGIFPYGRRVIMVVRWCARNGAITMYATQAVYGSTNGACSWSGPTHWTRAGGVGVSYVIIHGEIATTCDTPWWFHFHDNLWEEIRYGSQGVASFYDHN